jgi:hypothetical protein
MTSVTTDDDATTTPRLRASDAERASTVDLLKDAVAQGLLTPHEGSERMATAFAATYRDELPAMTADLPPAPRATVPAATAPGWRALAATLVAQLRHELTATRAAGVRSRRFAVSIVVAVLFFAVVVGLVTHGLWDGDHGAGFGGRR